MNLELRLRTLPEADSSLKRPCQKPVELVWFANFSASYFGETDDAIMQVADTAFIGF